MAQHQVKLAEFNDKLYGVISKCYIDGCYVHVIDSHGNILEHFRRTEKLPVALSRARDAYARCDGNCRCVEAYRWTVRVIAEDGSVEEIHYDEPAQRLHSLKVVRQRALCGSDQRRSVWQQAAADSPGSDRQRFPRCYEKQESGRKKMANTGMKCYCIS